MRLLPPEPSPGDKITAELVRELIRCIRERQIIKGSDYDLSVTPNGTLLRLKGIKGGGGASQALPWTFSCTVAEEGGVEVRTGGWTNCRLQIGMDIDWHSPDLDPSQNHLILGTDICDDGTHYLEVVLATGDGDRVYDSAEIKCASSAPVPQSDYIDGKIRIVIGTVSNGKIDPTEPCPHFNPVVYKYL